MTEFDFSTLADSPPSRFKVLQADKTQFRVEQKSTKTQYKILLNINGWGLPFFVHRMNPSIDKEFRLLMGFGDLRAALKAIGYIRS